MKTVFLTLLLSIATVALGQTNKAPAPVVAQKIFFIVEQMPEFPGGDEALTRFLQKIIVYPQMENENDIQGKVVVTFVVNEDGTVSDIAIKKGVSPGIDKEALRVVGMLPKFKPGKQQGIPVKVAYMLPIVFRLPGVAPVSTAIDSAHAVSK